MYCYTSGTNEALKAAEATRGSAGAAGAGGGGGGDGGDAGRWTLIRLGYRPMDFESGVQSCPSHCGCWHKTGVARWCTVHTVGLYKLNPVNHYMLESAWFQPFNLKCDILVSSFCFQTRPVPLQRVQLRHASGARVRGVGGGVPADAAGDPGHSGVWRDRRGDHAAHSAAGVHHAHAGGAETRAGGPDHARAAARWGKIC